MGVRKWAALKTALSAPAKPVAIYASEIRMNEPLRAPIRRRPKGEGQHGNPSELNWMLPIGLGLSQVPAIGEADPVGMEGGGSEGKGEKRRIQRRILCIFGGKRNGHLAR